MKTTTTEPATTNQKYTIRKNCNFNEDIKCEWVQWATDDSTKTSLNDLTKEQASKIIQQQNPSADKPLVRNKNGYAAFTKGNTQHKYILSLCIQYGWLRKSAKYGEVANLEKLDEWLRSDRSPVRKPLVKMTPTELSTIISALENMCVKRY